MSNRNDNFRNHNFHARIISEGYCCEWGYLELCRARGQTPSTMHGALGLARPTIYDHIRKLKNGQHTCRGKGDCMKDIIKEIEKCPATAPTDQPPK